MSYKLAPGRLGRTGPIQGPTLAHMPASYLARHRPICAVLAEIRTLAVSRGDVVTVKLCDEAIDYAQRMSVKLVQYKQEVSARSPV